MECGCKVRIEVGYLMTALRACGGMVDFAMTDGSSPVLFTTDGYQLVVMPMLTAESKAESKPEAEATEPEPEVTEPEAEGEVEAEPEAKAKPKRSRKREKVAVA
jgi:DNA polymerase III subunit beta